MDPRRGKPLQIVHDRSNISLTLTRLVCRTSSGRACSNLTRRIAARGPLPVNLRPSSSWLHSALCAMDRRSLAPGNSNFTNIFLLVCKPRYANSASLEPKQGRPVLDPDATYLRILNRCSPRTVMYPQYRTEVIIDVHCTCELRSPTQRGLCEPHFSNAAHSPQTTSRCMWPRTHKPRRDQRHEQSLNF